MNSKKNWFFVMMLFSSSIYATEYYHVNCWIDQSEKPRESLQKFFASSAESVGELRLG